MGNPCGSSPNPRAVSVRRGTMIPHHHCDNKSNTLVKSKTSLSHHDKQPTERDREREKEPERQPAEGFVAVSCITNASAGIVNAPQKREKNTCNRFFWFREKKIISCGFHWQTVFRGMDSSPLVNHQGPFSEKAFPLSSIATPHDTQRPTFPIVCASPAGARVRIEECVSTSE